MRWVFIDSGYFIFYRVHALRAFYRHQGHPQLEVAVADGAVDAAEMLALLTSRCHDGLRRLAEEAPCILYALGILAWPRNLPPGFFGEVLRKKVSKIHRASVSEPANTEVEAVVVFGPSRGRAGGSVTT